MRSPPALPRWTSVVAAVVVVAGLAYNLDGYPLLDPDEGRNAEVAREMAESNDYVLPQLNGLPYLDKPFLYFFVDALGMEVLGPTVLAARLPSLLFTLLTLGLVWWFAHRVIGGSAGPIAAVATGSMPLTLGFARTVIFDSTLTFFVVAAIAAFYLAVEQPPGAAPPAGERDGFWWAVAGWSAMALGVLTKGPVAIAIPLLVVVPFALWRRRGRRLSNVVALLTFVAILLPWVRAMTLRIPDFLEYSLVTETLLRLTTDEMNRTGPLWYFLPILIAGALPWSLVALGGLASAFPSAEGKDRSLLVFFSGWILVPLVFFSLSQSKRPQYILPLMPAVGLMVAAMWTRAQDRLPGVRAAAVALAVLGLVFVTAAGTVGRAFQASPGVMEAIPSTGYGLGLACLAGALVSWFLPRREFALIALALPVAVIPFVSTDLMNAIGRERSAASIGAAINSVRSSDTEVIAGVTYRLSLAVFVRSTLTVSTSNGAELTSNYLFRTLDRWRIVPGTTLRPPGWWRDQVARCDRPRLFVARNNDSETRATLAEALPLLAQNRKVTVYGPCDTALLARGISAPTLTSDRPR